MITRQGIDSAGHGPELRLDGPRHLAGLGLTSQGREGATKAKTPPGSASWLNLAWGLPAKDSHRASL